MLIRLWASSEADCEYPLWHADKHSPASSVRSTKRRVGCFCQWQLKAPTDRSRSDCVHEQVAKLGPVSRAAGMNCECPLYSSRWQGEKWLRSWTSSEARPCQQNCRDGLRISDWLDESVLQWLEIYGFSHARFEGLEISSRGMHPNSKTIENQ